MLRARKKYSKLFFYNRTLWNFWIKGLPYLKVFYGFFGIADILDLEASVERCTLDSGHCC